MFPTGSSSDDPLVKLTNKFKGLEVQDLLSDSEDTSPETSGEKPKKSKPKFELEDLVADWFMEIFFFFDDMHKMRLYLKKLWEDYRDGKVDVAVSSPIQS